MSGESITRDAWSFICASCGIFRATDEFLFALPEKDSPLSQQLYRLSYQFRQASEGLSKPIDLPVHRDEEIPSLLGAADPPVDKKLENLLSILGRASSYPGERVGFDFQNDYPLLSSKNEEEARFFLQSLSSQDLIELDEYSLDTTVAGCTLTARGWLELETLTKAGADSSDAFIAMWFHEDRTKYDHSIAKAIRDARYEPIRIDRIEHVNHIDDEIIARIRRSRFLVADFTGQRNGVYFEAGFMLGLGRPVIWLCEKSDLTNVHFDTRQYNTIDYRDEEDLYTRLKLRIEAVLGRGPL